MIKLKRRKVSLVERKNNFKFEGEKNLQIDCYVLFYSANKNIWSIV